MMYVRFIGTRICYTVMNGYERFYIGDVEEATSEELQLAKNGGGELPLSTAINLLAR